MAKPLTFEEKKSIPRHLRGAGRFRMKCRFCGGWHGSPVHVGFCKSNPKRRENLERAREKARVNGAKCDASKAREALKAWRADPANRERMRMMGVRLNEHIRATTGWSGPANGHYGHKISPEHRARLYAMRDAYNASRKREWQVNAEAREGLLQPPPQGPTSIFDLFGESRPVARAGGDLWFSVSDDDF